MKTQNEIIQFVNKSSLSDKDKESFSYLTERVLDKKLDEFTDRSFMFEGNPGIGKTYFIKNFLIKLNIPILYLGPFDFDSENIKRVYSLNELMQKLNKKELCAIFIDDLNNSFEFEYIDMGELRLVDAERKMFLKLLENLKDKQSQALLFMTVNDTDFVESSWGDRIECKVELEEPSEKSKKDFLKEKYNLLLSSRIINEISLKSIGYSFRNLDDMLKICYRNGKGKITSNIVSTAMKSFKPTGIKYELIDGKDSSFKDVIGHQKIKDELNKFKILMKEKNKLERLGVKRSNVLIFSGKNGIGKTMMAEALAGELGYILIKIKPMEMHMRPMETIRFISRRARKSKNCIFLIDEADKVFGRSSFDIDENPILADIAVNLENTNKNSLQGIIIFAVNNLFRLGKATKDRFRILEFDLPTEEDREEFIKRRLNKIDELKPIVSPKEISNLTTGFNFRDLEKLWDDIIFGYFDKGSISSEFIYKLTSSQKNMEINRMVG